MYKDSQFFVSNDKNEEFRFLTDVFHFLTVYRPNDKLIKHSNMQQMDLY